MRLTAALVIMAACWMPCAALAATLVPVADPPGSIQTWATGINDLDVVTGYFETSDQKIHGFVGTLSGGYDIFDIGANVTEPRFINNHGTITGVALADGFLAGQQFVRKADGSVSFVKRDGVLLDGNPGAELSSGDFVGDYWDNSVTPAVVRGYYGHKSRYRSDLTISANTNRTRPRYLSRVGTVVGYFRDLDDTDKAYRGFILKEGVLTVYDYPDPQAVNTQFFSMNAKGMVTGDWDDNGSINGAFVYDTVSATYQPILVPGATSFTFAGQINKAGHVAVASDAGSFVYCPKARNCPSGARAAIEIPLISLSALKNRH